MRRLFVILAAHLQNQDVENDLLLRQQYKKLTAFNISADVFVIGNEPPGRDNEKLMNMVRRDGLNYHRNVDWPDHGWELGAYRAGVALLKDVAAPADAVLFAQDSFVLTDAVAFAKKLGAWAAAGARPACLLTFPKNVAFHPDLVKRVKRWVGPSYDQGSNWRGCTFNSFIMSWRDVVAFEKLNIFAPATPDRRDSLALERYFGYIISHTSTPSKPSQFCGACGMSKVHLNRNDNKKAPRR